MQPEALADSELSAVVARGGTAARAAESELCRRYAPRIRLYGLRHLRSEERARDLVQAVLLAVLEAARAGRIEQRDKLDRFVLGTCRNLASSMRRSDARGGAGVELLPVELSLEPRYESVDMSALMGCFDRLELRAKKVVMLSFQEERTADEIADTLAITPGNVRVLRHRALLALRRCLDGLPGGGQ